MDTVDKKTRSRIMASVGQRNTGPEMGLRRVLHRQGLRYRLHDKKLPGSPDLIFPRFRTVVFIHGCFWHAHKGCKFATKPSTRKKFWKDKFEANRKRDRRNYEALKKLGWRVLVVWECTIRGLDESGLNQLGLKVVSWIESDLTYGEIGGLIINSPKRK